MQTVWSRVAQAQSICNCPSCLLTSSTIARRATTTPARRPIPVGNIFTLSLSSLAAGLAFADSKKKDNRRKQWDKAIGEARASVEETEIQQQSRLAALSDGARMKASEYTRSDGYCVPKERAVEEVESLDVQETQRQEQRPSKFDSETDTWLDVFDWAREQQDLREASGFHDWKGVPLNLLQSLSGDELHRLLSDGRLLRRLYGGPDCDNLVGEWSTYPLSRKKIRTLEWSVQAMVLKLLMYSSRYSVETVESSGCPINFLLHGLRKDRATMQSKLDYARARLRTLAANCLDHTFYEQFERPQVPNYRYLTVKDYEETNETNTSLMNLLEAMEHETDLHYFISKICHNLLTARTPPNIHTYNMLLIRFCVLKKNVLVTAVLTSIRESHVRPNEITHATSLHHYNETGNLFGFNQYWSRMEGYGKRSVIANPEQIIDPIVRERFLVCGQNHQKVAEKGRINAQVYESLIIGALRFLGPQTAMLIYRKMIGEGWSPGHGILLAILQDCCYELDWTVGIAVLEQLEKSANRINSLTYEWMLRLCQCCGQKEFFDQILRNGVHCGALPASMLNVAKHAEAADIDVLVERAKDLQPHKAVDTFTGKELGVEPAGIRDAGDGGAAVPPHKAMDTFTGNELGVEPAGVRDAGDSGAAVLSHQTVDTLADTATRIRWVANSSVHIREWYSDYLGVRKVSHDRGEREQAFLHNAIEELNHRWKARFSLQHRLEILAAVIDRTVLEVNHTLYSSNEISSTKFWLSRRIKHLERKMEKDINSKAFASYCDMVILRDAEVQKRQPRKKPENRRRQAFYTLKNLANNEDT